MSISLPDELNLTQLLRTIATMLGHPLPVACDAEPELAGRSLAVDVRAVGKLHNRLAHQIPKTGTAADGWATIALETHIAGTIVCRDLHAQLLRQVNACAAALVTNVLRRAQSLGTFSDETLSAIQEALLATYMTNEQLFEVLVMLCEGDHGAGGSFVRPRPDPENGPIISIGTPISFVEPNQQEDALGVASAVQEAIETIGYQVDVPGRFIHPSGYTNQSLVDRDITARAALACASAFLGIDAQNSRRGMGFAVALMESMGAPVLLMPGGVEEYVFARVFGGRLAHREEVIYDSADEAASHATRFLRDHEACIMERHRMVTDARSRLGSTANRLAIRLNAIDKAIFSTMPLTEAKARFLSDDPVHLAQTLPWELKFLARAVGENPVELAAEVYAVPMSRVRSLGASGAPAKAVPPPHSRRNDEVVLTQREYRAFRAAGATHPGWVDEKGLQLLDEYMEAALSDKTAARRKRTDDMDWIAAYERRFR